MIKGVTESGFEFELEDDILDDYELLEVLHKIDKGDYGLVPDMVEKLLGVEQKESLKNHIRTDKGKVSSSRMMDEIMQIFKANNKLKNS